MIVRFVLVHYTQRLQSRKEFVIGNQWNHFHQPNNKTLHLMRRAFLCTATVDFTVKQKQQQQLHASNRLMGMQNVNGRLLCGHSFIDPTRFSRACRRADRVWFLFYFFFWPIRNGRGSIESERRTWWRTTNIMFVIRNSSGMLVYDVFETFTHVVWWWFQLLQSELLLFCCASRPPFPTHILYVYMLKLVQIQFEE